MKKVIAIILYLFTLFAVSMAFILYIYGVAYMMSRAVAFDEAFLKVKAFWVSLCASGVALITCIAFFGLYEEKRLFSFLTLWVFVCVAIGLNVGMAILSI